MHCACLERWWHEIAHYVSAFGTLDLLCFAMFYAKREVNITSRMYALSSILTKWLSFICYKLTSKVVWMHDGRFFFNTYWEAQFHWGAMKLGELSQQNYHYWIVFVKIMKTVYIVIERQFWRQRLFLERVILLKKVIFFEATSKKNFFLTINILRSVPQQWQLSDIEKNCNSNHLSFSFKG